jgi:hypothetical protein
MRGSTLRGHHVDIGNTPKHNGMCSGRPHIRPYGIHIKFLY